MVQVTYLRLSLVAAAVCIGFAAMPAAMAGSMPPDAARLSVLERQMADMRAKLPRLELAQAEPRPLGNVPDADSPEDAYPGPRPTDAAGLDVRVDRLENQMRTLTGQIEQTQFAIGRLEESVKKIEAALAVQDTNGPRVPQRRADADLPADAAGVPGADIGPTAVPTRQRHGDAFDPAAQPAAPGAPRPLGGNLPTGPLSTDQASAQPAPGPRVASPAAPDPDATGPLDLSNGGAGAETPRVQDNLAPASAAAPPPPLPGPSTVAPSPALTASLPAGGSTREDFEQAIALLRQSQYEAAQTSFEAFLQKYPHDRLAADAVYYLGETYSLRGRHREAAEQYLKVATDYSKSAKAPEGLIKLGMSLNALGAKEQACATFGEVTRKYPNASAAVKNSVDREIRRARC